MPAFSPDGRRLAYKSCAGSAGCDVYVVDLDASLAPTSAPRRLTAGHWIVMGRITWARDGRSVIYHTVSSSLGWDLYRVAVDGSGRPERIELAGTRAGTPATAMSRDRLAFVRSLNDVDVYRLEPGRTPQAVSNSSVDDFSADVSPDGHHIAFDSSRAGDTVEVWVAAPDGSDARQLTHGPGRWQGSPHWSPHGQRIAFDSQGEDGHWHVWTIDAEGGGLRQVTTMHGDQNAPSWSADGAWLYFSADSGTGKNIWRSPAAGGTPQQLTTEGSGSLARESADGHTLFYQASQHGALWAHPLAGGPAHEIVRCSFGAFTVGAQGVYFVPCASAGEFVLHVLDPATGRDRVFGTLEHFATTHESVSISPDGSFALYDRFASEGTNLMLIENFR
jgi:Tol biopolymer transport system component